MDAPPEIDAYLTSARNTIAGLVMTAREECHSRYLYFNIRPFGVVTTAISLGQLYRVSDLDRNECNSFDVKSIRDHLYYVSTLGRELGSLFGDRFTTFSMIGSGFYPTSQMRPSDMCCIQLT